MKNLILYTVISLFFILAFSCNGGNSSLEVNCGECYTSEPDSFELVLSLSIGQGFDYDSAYVQFFIEKAESEKLSWEGFVYTPTFYHLVPVNKYYSVKATYYEPDNKQIIAVDGDKMVTRYIADGCNDDCWIVKGNLLDVRLKY